MTIGNEINARHQGISGHQRSSSNLIIKDWQFNITNAVRATLVENIVKAILPNNSHLSTVLIERRRLCDSLFQFAYKNENEMFNKSDSKGEYLFLISKKIQLIKREFEQRRLLRKIDNLNLVNNKSISSTNKQSSWIQTLTCEYREQIVKKILQLICPKANSETGLVNRLIKYAQRIESDIYKIASSKDQYYQLINDRMQKILIELNYKRFKRDHLKNQVRASNQLINQLPKTADSSRESSTVLMKSNLNSTNKIYELQMIASDQ